MWEELWTWAPNALSESLTSTSNKSNAAEEYLY